MHMATWRIWFAVALSALSGCAVLFGGRRELCSTATFRVTPGDGVWDDEYGKTGDASGCSFEFRVVRYRDGIGVKARTFDDRVVVDGCGSGEVTCPSWNDDGIECFFDGDNDRSPNARAGRGTDYGGAFALAANGAAQSDFSARPRGYGRDWKGRVEVRPREGGGFEAVYDLWFSWACIGRFSAPDDDEDLVFGFNICMHDDDDGGRSDRALYWKGNPSCPYRDESMFGTIVLKGNKGKGNQ